MRRTKSDESLRVLLRLLVDEIVEDLSRSGAGCKSRSVQKQTCLGDAASYRVRLSVFSKDTRVFEGTSKAELV